nr:PREDICTED: calmodulin-like protein 1 isoform X2 [Daucus carota subsp. sativus]
MQYNIKFLRKPSRILSFGSRQNSGSLPVPEPNTDEMRQIFDKFDIDRDGKISHEEYKVIIRAVQKDSTSKDVQKIFEVADLDGDGFISYEEFVNVQKRGGVLKMVDIQNAFRVFDLNGDGKISEEEIFELMERLGEKCSLQDCRKMAQIVEWHTLVWKPGSNIVLELIIKA